jgi:peptide chain release factor subunit 1
MPSWEQIEQLERFESEGASVLSLYLDLTPTSQVTRSYRVEFKDLVKEASGRLTDAERKGLDREVERVNAWFEGTPALQGLGLTIFSCTPRKLWLVDFVPVAVRNHLAFETKPDVAGLLELIDEYERFAVALVSKNKARVFTVFAGAIEEIDAFKDLVPGKVAAGGLKQSIIQRHHELHVLWHLKKVVAYLSTLQRRRNFDRLIIAGPVEATSELQQMLPPVLSTRVAAVIRADVDATNAQILERTIEVERRIEADCEDHLVNGVLEMARSGARATCGIRPTLDALWMGDVRVMVVADGVAESGSECSNCRYIQQGNAASCQKCGAATRAVRDLGHYVMGRAVEQRGRVEIVHGRAAQHLSTVGEGLAAFLRYPSEPARSRM